jgi:ATP-dependent Zn protease
VEKQTKFNLWYLVIALMAVVWLRDVWVGMSQVQAIPYSEFQHHLKAGELEEIAISNNLIQGKLKRPTPDGRTRIVTTRVDPALAKELSQYDVRFTGVMERYPRLDRPGTGVLRHLDVARQAHGGAGRHRRHDVDRQEQGEGVRRDRHQGYLRGRRRGGRGQG